MAIDFNNEEEQKERSNGTIPPGSKVLVVLSIEKPTYAHDLHDYVSVSKQGLLGLWVKYTVIAGTYEGSKWHENIWLQEGQQEINLNDGQRTAAASAGHASGLSSKPVAASCRKINPPRPPVHG